MDISLSNDTYKYEYGIYNKRYCPFLSKDTIDIYVMKRDEAYFQVLFYDSEGFMLTVSDEACFDKRGSKKIIRMIVKSEELFETNINLVGLITDDDGQDKSDLLLNESVIEVEKEKVQAAFVTIKTDENTKTGIYILKVRLYEHNMFESEREIACKTVKLHVANEIRPLPKDNEFYLDLWQHNSNIARKYDVERFGERHFEILEEYIKCLSELGQKSITVIASDIPWSGQMSCYVRKNPSDLFEYNYIKVTKKSDGYMEYDYSYLERYIKICNLYGINEELEIFGLLNIWQFEDAGFSNPIKDHDDAIRVRYFDEKSNTYCYMDTFAQTKDYIRSLGEYFKEKGLENKVRILADEPSDLERFRKRLNIINKLCPDWKVKVCINNISFMEADIEGIDHYVPKLDCLLANREDYLENRRKIDGRICYYVCCNPKKPNTFLSSPLIESRIIPLLAMYLRVDGFLRWNFTAWPDDPINSLSYRFPNWPAGDTQFVYPGKDGKPMLSLRYLQLKKGIRDYEIVTRYGNSGVLDKVFSLNKGEINYETDAEVYEEIVKGLLSWD